MMVTEMPPFALADERRSRLLELVRVRGFAALPDLAEELQVSESTIRRDLDYLEEAGEARRTHGGVLYTGPSPKLQHFDQRQQANWEKKRQIAQAASRLIEDGDTILLDGGSTTYELARLLVHRALQVVTNSLPVASLFTGSDADLVLVGGYVHTRTGVSLGPYANQMLGELNVRRAVLSVAGINEKGYYNSNLLLVETERAMMRAADEVIVVADSTKFGHTSLAHLCDLGDIDRLVVDSEITPGWRNRLVKAGVDLVVAGPSGETSNSGSTHGDGQPD
jgi:DeoR/GlpR family transcriptional regulator of sugar metabolism